MRDQRWLAKVTRGHQRSKVKVSILKKIVILLYDPCFFFLLEKRRQIEMRLRLFYTLFCKLFSSMITFFTMLYDMFHNKMAILKIQF